MQINLRRIHPTLTYGIVVAGAFFRWIEGAVPAFIASYFPEVTAVVFWGFLCSFLIGLLIADSCNNKSWIHKYWRDWNRLFDVHALHSEHIRDDPERVAVYVLLKFIREIRSGELIVTVMPSYTGASPFVIHNEPQLSAPVYEDRRLTICTMMLPSSKLAI